MAAEDAVDLFALANEKFENAINRFAQADAVAGGRFADLVVQARAYSARELVSAMLLNYPLVRAILSERDFAHIEDFMAPFVPQCRQLIEFLVSQGLDDLFWRYVDFFLTVADEVKQHGRNRAAGSVEHTGSA